MGENRFSVLVADENSGCCEEFRQTLEPEGYAVRSVASGREALRIVRSEPVHVVVMEIRLPDYSGPEVYHAIKDTRDRFVPCIFTALEMTTRSLQEALSEDAITILPKPVDRLRLVRAVDWSIVKYYSRRAGWVKRIGRGRLSTGEPGWAGN